MFRSKRRLTWLVASVALFSLVAAACGDSDESTTDTTAGDSSSTTEAAAGYDYESLTGTLNGTGSSFQDAFEQKSITQFKSVASGVSVSYTKSGSSAGKQDLQNGVVQFAGSDSLVKPEDVAKFKGEFLYFPTVAAPITVSYNLPDVAELNLSADVLAGIMQTEITSWDDDKIAADNPDATLPAMPIVVVHRSDGSGTTNNFTKFLKAAAPSVWTLDAGDTVNWSASTQAAEKNSGVASLISTTEGAIGYVDLADAVNADLQLALIQNKEGEFVEPTLAGANAALEGAKVNDDLTYDPLNAAGDESYPITSPTWILVYAEQPDQATADALKGWLNFLLTDGQEFANSVGFARLPEALVDSALAQLDSITVGTTG